MRNPIIVDGRNLFNPAEMRERGFEYYSLGRGDVTISEPDWRVKNLGRGV